MISSKLIRDDGSVLDGYNLTKKTYTYDIWTYNEGVILGGISYLAL